jgi:hypothetical protein
MIQTFGTVTLGSGLIQSGFQTINSSQLPQPEVYVTFGQELG